jgi:hypothetical protein
MSDAPEAAFVSAQEAEKSEQRRPRPPRRGSLPPKQQEGGNRPVVMINTEPDVALERLKELVSDNYNAHRNPRRTPPLEPGLLHVTWFAQSFGSWRAVLLSDVLHGLRYEVSYNRRTAETSIEVYKRVNNVQVPSA